MEMCCTFEQAMVHTEVVKLLGEVVQFQSVWQHLLCRTEHFCYTLSGGWSRSSVHAHINLQRRWYSQLGTAFPQGTSNQVLTPDLDWVSISLQKVSHPLLHPPWTWDGVQPDNIISHVYLTAVLFLQQSQPVSAIVTTHSPNSSHCVITQWHCMSSTLHTHKKGVWPCTNYPAQRTDGSYIHTP